MDAVVSYRITKFDPGKRDENGAYLDSAEWTSMSDIGKSAYGTITFADYARIEAAYVNAVKAVMADQGIDSLEVQDLESHFVTSKRKFEQFRSAGGFEGMQVEYHSDFKGIENGLRISGEQIDKMVRLVLREHLWMLLVDKKLEVRFGYDYYMYVQCIELKPTTVKQIESTGLFVEKNIAQRQFIISLK